MKRSLVLALVGVACAGCGSHETRFGELRVLHTGSVTLHPTPRPHFGGPGPNVADVAFVSRRLGFVATGHYRGEPPAAIQETVDGGDTWHDALLGHRATTFAWLAVGGTRVIYAGGWGPGGGPALLVTRDAGESWTTLRPHPNVDRWRWVSSRASFVTPKLGYTFTDPASFMDGVFLLTRDGGRTWRRLEPPKYTIGIQFVDTLHGYAAGTVEHGCTGAAWRTDDGGTSWKQIFCGKVPLAAVQFLDARRGFLAGGWAQVTEEAPSGVLYATTDGGATWQRRFSNPNRGFSAHGMQPIVDLRFFDGRSGWARTGECKCCPSGLCAGDVLVTRDGGRTWARRGNEVELATVGLRDAWSTPRCDVDCNVVWRTRNAGLAWRPLARPDLLELNSVQWAGGLVSLSTSGGRFVSMDGTRWRFANADVLAARPGFAIELPSTWPRRALTSRHGSHAFAFTGRAVDFVNSAVAADSRHAYALPYLGYGVECKRESTRTLYVTNDGGRSWSRRRTPFNIASLAADGRRVAMVGVGAGCTNLLALSDDNAHTWRVRELPQKGCAVSVADADVWLGCGRVLLTSTDRGRTWARIEAPKRFDSSRIAAAGRGAAWGLFWQRGAGVRLWHTADAGRTWVEQWPRLPTP